MTAVATNITSPSTLASIAARAEAGTDDALLRLGQGMPAVLTWDNASALAFAKLCDERVIAFLWHEFGPFIAKHAPLAEALAENSETIREGMLNSKRWDFRAGREV